MTAAQTVAELHMLRKRCAELEEQLETLEGAARRVLERMNPQVPWPQEYLDLLDAIGSVSYPASQPWKYGDPIKGTMTVSSPANVQVAAGENPDAAGGNSGRSAPYVYSGDVNDPGPNPAKQPYVYSGDVNDPGPFPATKTMICASCRGQGDVHGNICLRCDGSGERAVSAPASDPPPRMREGPHLPGLGMESAWEAQNQDQGQQ